MKHFIFVFKSCWLSFALLESINLIDSDKNETLGSETETFDFQSEQRSTPRPSYTLPRPRRDLQVLVWDETETETLRGL